MTDYKYLDLSTDYELLWNRINQGYRVPAYVYNNRCDMMDIVDVKMIYDYYSIGSRGISYSGYDKDFESFKTNCLAFDLKFIK